MLQQDLDLSLEDELRAAILDDAFALHYQPIRGADDFELVAYESLLRWTHPVRGVVPPLQFIPVAEQGTLIHDLGFWVLRRACRDLAALNTRYVGVNVSAVQLQRGDFASNVARIFREEKIEPVQVTIEITESVALHDYGTERRNLEMLREMGCYVAIDDFGTGYASFDYIERFPFNVLKIDKSFIGGLGRSPPADAFVASLCELGRQRNIVTVAEGVETPEQLGLLQRMGCSRVQGYLLGRPAPLGAWIPAAPPDRSKIRRRRSPPPQTSICVRV